MEGFEWLNPPASFEFTGPNSVKMVTKDHTDFWQRTQHEFRNDSGHFLYKRVKGDFTISADCYFKNKALYDHSGIYLRINEDNWLKCACEYDNEEVAQLGVVMTNLGYSDWSKTEVSARITRMMFKIQRKGQDCFVWAGEDADHMKEIRVCHFLKESEEMMVGVYACSPQGDALECEMKDIQITQ